MVAVTLAIVLSVAAGVWAERRWGGRAGIASRRGLMFVLYVVLPPTTFFNLAAADIDADIGVGVVLAIVAVVLATGLAYLVGSKVLGLSRASIGSLMCCTLVGNTGYLGYAMVAVLLGFDRLSEAVVYDILVAAPGAAPRRLLGRSGVRKRGRARARESARSPSSPATRPSTRRSSR